MTQSFCDVKPKQDNFVFHSVSTHARIVCNEIVLDGRYLPNSTSLGPFMTASVALDYYA